MWVAQFDDRYPFNKFGFEVPLSYDIGFSLRDAAWQRIWRNTRVDITCQECGHNVEVYQTTEHSPFDYYEFLTPFECDDARRKCNPGDKMADGAAPLEHTTPTCPWCCYEVPDGADLWKHMMGDCRMRPVTVEEMAQRVADENRTGKEKAGGGAAIIPSQLPEVARRHGTGPLMQPIWLSAVYIG